MIRNYVRKFEGVHSFEDIDDEDIEIELRQPSEKVLEDFFKAIETNNIDEVKRYINLGYDVNAKDYHGHTGMLYASSCGLYDIAKLLLKSGADVNHKNEVQMTPLITACYSFENKNLVELLLKNGADVNAQAEDGRTALYYACAFNNEDVVRLLLEYGADVNIKEMYDRTPLMIACCPYKNKVNKNIVDMLIKYGADINAEDDTGKTAYDYCPARNKRIRELLI